MAVIVVYKESWHFDFMNVKTLCFRSNITKDSKPKPDGYCWTESEQTRINFIAMAAEPWPGEEILYFSSLILSS